MKKAILLSWIMVCMMSAGANATQVANESSEKNKEQKAEVTAERLEKNKPHKNRSMADPLYLPKQGEMDFAVGSTRSDQDIDYDNQYKTTYRDGYYHRDSLFYDAAAVTGVFNNFSLYLTWRYEQYSHIERLASNDYSYQMSELKTDSYDPLFGFKWNVVDEDYLPFTVQLEGYYTKAKTSSDMMEEAEKIGGGIKVGKTFSHLTVAFKWGIFKQSEYKQSETWEQKVLKQEYAGLEALYRFSKTFSVGLDYTYKDYRTTEYEYSGSIPYEYRYDQGHTIKTEVNYEILPKKLMVSGFYERVIGDDYYGTYLTTYTPYYARFMYNKNEKYGVRFTLKY